MNNLENLNILITGASGGIGTCLSKAFTSTKANLFLLGSSEDRIAKLRDELPSRDNINYFSVDLGKRENVTDFCDSMIEKYGGMSVVINNAGVTDDNLFIRMSDSSWDKVFAINLNASMIICRKFIRGMMKNKWGRIVFISSVVGLSGNQGQANYAASKAGLIGLAKSISKEMGSRNITSNVVAPGYIETEMTSFLDDQNKENIIEQLSIKRIGKPEDISNIVSFLCNDESEYITGQVIPVDGGLTT